MHGSGETITRYKIWKGSGTPCHGRILRGICSMGSGDIPGVIESHALFANKFHLEWEAVTLTCLQMWYKDKAENSHKSRLNLTYYYNLPYLKYRTLWHGLYISRTISKFKTKSWNTDPYDQSWSTCKNFMHLINLIFPLKVNNFE